MTENYRNYIYITRERIYTVDVHHGHSLSIWRTNIILRREGPHVSWIAFARLQNLHIWTLLLEVAQLLNNMHGNEYILNMLLFVIRYETRMWIWPLFSVFRKYVHIRTEIEIVIEMIIVILDNPFSNQRKSGNSDTFWENQRISFWLRRKNQGILFHIKYQLHELWFFFKKKKARPFGARVYKINLKKLACVFDAKM